MTTPRHSRQEKLQFSGREEDFPAFLEQFEARVYTLGLSDTLLDKVKTTPAKDVETQQETDDRVKEETDLQKWRYMVWCELVQCLDKASINFIRGHKPNGTAAWAALTKLHKSSERPRVQSLMSQLTGLKMTSGEKVTDYLTKAEGLKLDLAEAGETISNTLFSAMVLKGLPSDFDSVVAVLNFGAQKSYEEMKQDLVNFATTRGLLSTSDGTMTAFHSDDQKPLKCHKCGKKGHRSKDCRGRETRECYSCGKKGHLASNCRQKGQQQRGSGPPGQGSSTSNHSSTDFFSFGAFDAGPHGDGDLELLIDSGCNGFMIKDRELFSHLDEDFRADVGNANSSRSAIMGRGTVRCSVLDSRGKQCQLELTDAFWVPSYARNLVSVKRLADKGAKMDFGAKPRIKMPNGTHIPMRTEDELFSIRVQAGRGSLAHSSFTIDQWHQVMGHNNIQDVAKLQNEVEGMAIKGSQKGQPCNVCSTEKAKRAAIPKTWGTRAKARLDIVHTDVLGPIQQQSYDGFRYAVGFIDSFSRFGAVYPMKTKDEVVSKLQQYIIDVGTPRTLVSDGALEFKSKQFNDVCRTSGIKQQYSAPYTPEENGKIERAWGTVTGMARCMMATAGVPKQLWPYALSTAVYLKNRSIHSAHNRTPFEMFHGMKPDISQLHIFGCKAFVLNEVRKKLDSKAREAVLLGYSHNSKTYVVASTDATETRAPRIWTSRNVTFNDAEFPYREGAKDTAVFESSDEDPADDGVKSEVEGGQSSEDEQSQGGTTTGDEAEEEDTGEEEEQEAPIAAPPTPPPARTSGRARQPPPRFGDYVTGEELENLALHCDALLADGLPRDADVALEDPNWKAAMDKEYQSLEDNGVWELVPAPKDKGIISGKWHFAHKLDNMGNVVKFKARFVARGFTQTPGIDFHETYSPTAKLSTLRTVVACGVKLGMLFHQMDIKTAYLNAPIHEDIFMQQPQGYVKGDGLVCKLKRSLYGLKQSGRNWFECLTSHLKTLNFKPSVHDPCLQTMTRKGHQCWVVIWVDDILSCSTDPTFDEWFKKRISQRFTIGETGPLTWFLGTSFNWDRGEVTISHQGYVRNFLRKHGMDQCKAASTPLAEKTELSKDQMPEDGSDAQKEMKGLDYRGIVGSIAYLSLTTRPDLAYAAHLLARFLSNPGQAHWQAAKHVLRYLQGTSDVGITYRKGGDSGLTGYADADYASCKDDRRSITGFCFNLGSGAISWAARRQTCVATSTTEAEVHAVSEATKEAVHLQGILEALSMKGNTTIYTDSQSCQALAVKEDNSAKTKHYATRMAYVRETIKAGAIDIQYVPSEENSADIFTKGLGKTKTLHHLARLTAKRGCQDLPSASQGGNRKVMQQRPLRSRYLPAEQKS